MALLLNVEHPEQMDAVLYFFSRHQPVALPSETVYGLAAPFDDEKALSEVFRLKNRPTFNPLILHVNSISQVSSLVKEIPPLAEKLMKHFWPGPLTLLLEKNSKVPDLCTGKSSWVGVRSPDHPVFKKIIAKTGKALAAPSANRYQGISPVCSQDVLEELGPYGLEAVVEGGRSTLGLESTVIRVPQADVIEVLRLGAITLESLKKICGETVRLEFAQVEESKTVDSPGQVKKHYSPKTECLLFDLEAALIVDPEEDVLLKVLSSDEQNNESSFFKNVSTLSEKNCLETASAELFSTLRVLDQKKFRRIFLLKTSDENLGRSINDRLKRAAAK